MRNFLKLCLVGTIVAGGVTAVCDEAFAGVAETAINTATRAGKQLVSGNKTGAAKTGIDGAGKGTKQLLKNTGKKSVPTNKMTGGLGKGGGTSGSGGANVTPTRLQTGNQGTQVIKPTTTTTVNSGTAPTGSMSSSSVKGLYQSSQHGAIDNLKVGQSTTINGDTVTRTGTNAYTVTGKEGQIVQTSDGSYKYLTTKANMNPDIYTTGADVKTSGSVASGTNAGASSGVKGWKEGEIYKGNGTQTGTTEIGSPIYKDGVQIIETNDVGEITSVKYDVKLSDGKGVNVGDTIYSDGKFSKVTGINPDGSLKLESGATVNPSDSLSTFSSKGLDGADVSYAQGADGKTIVGSDGSQFELKDGKWEQTAEGKVDEAKAKAAEAKAAVDTGNETNAIQYAIVILQAIEGMNQEDATRTVTVEGAQKLQDSQGSPTDSTIPSSDTSLDGSNLSCAANSLAYLLRENPVDTSLMDVSDLDPTTSAGQVAIKNRRNQLLQEYAVSAAIVAAGSNAISSQFYMRVAQLAATASETTGTLGSMSVLNDSERYPYFEMVRQVALSGVQLGLKGASTLSHVVVGSVLSEEENGGSGDNSGGNGGSDDNSGGNGNPGNGSEGNE